VHETPTKSPPPAGLGIDRIVQLWPFQRSANGVPCPCPPTAVQAFADAHETPLSTPRRALGVDWIVHLWPFQRSAKVPRRIPAALARQPTATQTFADEQETLVSEPPPEGGAGADVSVHVPAA
jgi:hypothetical protein